MIHVMASAGVVDPLRPKTGAKEIFEAGFSHTYLDLGLFCSPDALEAAGTTERRAQKREICPSRWVEQAAGIAAHPEKLPEYVRPVLDALQGCNLNTALMRAPCLSPESKRTDLGPVLLRLVQESIALCGEAGCHELIVPPCLTGADRGGEWEAIREQYLPLAAPAREKGVTILLENQCRWFRHRPVRGALSDPARMAEWIDRLNREAGEERFGLCLNNWMCSACKMDLREYIVALGPRIKAIHINSGDLHGLFCALREIDFDGTLIFYKGDEISTTMRPSLLRLARETAEYYAWQICLERTLRKYSSIVLFGAGNMLRNYMYCYGKQYPPLCACDNNPSHWGREIHGVTVYPPEKLLELPPECGIFICNMYYREIGEQLKALGVERFERFSDEYLPRYPLE